MDTALFVSCRQKRLTRRLQDQTTSVRQRDTAPLCCHQKHTRKAAKKMEGQETACQKAFCQSVADHCMCPPPANRLCALHWKDTVAWYSFHWNTAYGHETNIHFKMCTKVLQLMSYFPSPRSWNDIFSITKSSQRNPVLTTTPSSRNGCNGATKYEHSIHVPNWKMASIFWSAPTIPSLQATLQQSNKTSPLSYSTPKKNNRTDVRCIPQIKSNTFGWDSLMCEILPLKSFSMAILSLS